jgi:hypothetical protein
MHLLGIAWYYFIKFPSLNSVCQLLARIWFKVWWSDVYLRRVRVWPVIPQLGWNAEWPQRQAWNQTYVNSVQGSSHRKQVSWPFTLHPLSTWEICTFYCNVFLRGKYYTHVLFTICCNQGEFFPLLPFITVVKTGILMCNFISPTSNVYCSFVRL